MTPDPALSFADLLRRLRRSAGLTQDELARRARLGARSISDLERGISTAPRRDTVALIADALRLDGQTRADLVAAALAGRADLMARRSESGTGSPDLPTLPLPLVGRDAERKEIGALLLAHDVRLVTLTGSPGIGKTSLAVQVASDMTKHFPQGVVFVPLATVLEPDLVASAIARRMGVVADGDRPIRMTLIDHLGEKRMLLVLDNFEQVLPAAPLLRDLASADPRLSILVTSRAILNLRGEHQFAVPSLAVPDLGSLHGRDDADRYSAVRLFVERARAAQPGFDLTDAVAPVVGQVCRRLNGVPLAIELAAARIRVLTPSQLLARLDRSLSVLVGGAQDLPERQQTLRTAIAWSYDLLDRPSQELFRRLSVFAGGWTLEAAELTCGHGEGTLDGLTSLVEKSLAQRRAEAGATPRFELLETLREYGLERLAEHGEAAEQRAVHASYFERLAVESEVALQGPDQADWLARLEAEHDNLREALRWARDTGEIDVGLRTAAALWRFWEVHVHLVEGRAWLDDLLALDDQRGLAAEPARMRARADALHGAGTMALRLGDYQSVVDRMRECLSIRRKLADAQGAVVALNGLANAAVYQGDYPRATALYGEALTLARGAGRPRHIAGLLGNLAIIANERGDYANAEALAVESLALQRELRDMASTANAHDTLGNIHLRQGSFAAAEEHLQECLAIYRGLRTPVASAYAVLSFGVIAAHQAEPDRAAELVDESLLAFRAAGDRRGCGQALHLLGEVAVVRGDTQRALSYLDEGLALFQETADRLGVINVLEGRGRLALAQQDQDWAARLFGLAAGMRDLLGIPVWAVDQASYHSEIAAITGAMPKFEAARALTAGPDLPADLVDLAALAGSMAHLSIPSTATDD